MQYLHIMVRVSDLDESLKFFCNKLGFVEMGREEDQQQRHATVFLTASEDEGSARSGNAPLLALRHSWEREELSAGRNFGYITYGVEDIYDLCGRLMDAGVTINRPPRDGRSAIIKSPDNIAIQFLQKGEPLEPKDPWASMEDVGGW